MTQRYADLYTVLATCFQHPDDAFVTAVEDGTLATTIEGRAQQSGLTAVETPPAFEGSPQEAYLRTFEAFDGEYAPPAESAYETWWDGDRRGILAGPPASDMQRRYEAIDAEVPAAYPADHVSLLLEYGGLLLETESLAEYALFHDEHFDWIPAFRERVEATSRSPFYHWAVQTLDRVTTATRSSIGEPSER